jgi:hypothetical protein
MTLSERVSPLSSFSSASMSVATRRRRVAKKFGVDTNQLSADGSTSNVSSGSED